LHKNHYNNKKKTNHKKTTEESSLDMPMGNDHDQDVNKVIEADNYVEQQQQPQQGSNMAELDFTNTVAAWWNAVAEWEDGLEPIKLALELVANITVIEGEPPQPPWIHHHPNVSSSLEQLLEQLHHCSQTFHCLKSYKNLSQLCKIQLLYVPLIFWFK
jgi:hypothetical protein